MQKFSRTIGIIGAMDREVESIKDALYEPFTERIAGADFTVGIYMGLRVVAVVSGIGLMNAACTTQCMIDRYAPDSIIFSGISGSLNPIVGVDDIVVGKTLLYSDATRQAIAESHPFAEEYETDGTLIGYAVSALEEEGYIDLDALSNECGGDAEAVWSKRNGRRGYIVGTIASGNKFVTSAEKDALKDDTDADCAEMEGAAIVHAADRNSTSGSRIRTVVIRSMSDTCGDEPFMTDGWQLDAVRTAESAARRSAANPSSDSAANCACGTAANTRTSIPAPSRTGGADIRTPSARFASRPKTPSTADGTHRRRYTHDEEPIQASS